MNSLLSAHNISVDHDQQRVLNNVSMQVQANDFITIIGPNGAGKSTLLKCLMGLTKPDEGHVERKPSLTIGYVPQRLSMDQTIPISARRFLTLRKTVDVSTFDEVVAETKLSPFLDKPLHVLSGGEMQRILLARALLGDPELLILDEPAQNLDVAGQLSFYKLLEQIFARREVSILMVSHDLHLVMSSTKQVVCLYHHICCTGKPQTVTKDPEFISLFGDDMARMLAIYHHSHDHDHDHATESVHA